MTPSGGSRVQIAAFLLLLTLGASAPPFAEAFKQEFLNFTFYFHDFFLEPVGSSAFLIVQPIVPPAVPLSPTDSFLGGVVVFDDSLTTGPNVSDLEIGRGRGIYAFDVNSTLGPGIEMLWTAEFNNASGYGEGSTLTFKGFDRLAQPVREIAVVGGTGKFRLARGWADLTTYSFSGTASATLKIAVTVYYGLGY